MVSLHVLLRQARTYATQKARASRLTSDTSVSFAGGAGAASSDLDFLPNESPLKMLRNSQRHALGATQDGMQHT